VVEREYRLTLKGRKRQKVLLRIGKPRPLPGGRDYICVYQYTGLGNDDRTRFAGGVDSMQAILLAMQMALVELVCSAAYRSGTLTWEGSFDLARGLPLPDAIKDLVWKDPPPRRRRPAAAAARRRSPDAACVPSCGRRCLPYACGRTSVVRSHRPIVV
jgi:hypothetical protein